MLSPAGMNPFALLLVCLLPLVAGAQADVPDAGPTPEASPAPPPTANPSAPDAGTPCTEPEDAPGTSASILGSLQLRVEGRAQTLAGIEWKGLQRLTEDQVRTLTGLPAQGALTVEEATRGLRRLARTDLFARIAPTVRLAEATAPTLEVTVEEHPFVAAIAFQGLQDFTPPELLKELFSQKREADGWEVSVHDEDSDEDQVITLHVDEQRLRVTVAPAPVCPPARPPPEWLARLDARGAFQPGLVAGGLTAALERMLEELRDDGYLLAGLTATLHPDGHLEVTVDEGRIEAVDVEGVDADTVPRVREALGIHPGDTFLRSDMQRAVRRLEQRMPHLAVREVERRRREVRVVEERGEDGTRHYRTADEEEKPKSRRQRVSVDIPWAEALDEWWNDGDDKGPTEGVTTQGRRVVVRVRPRRPDFDLELLPVHTQVTGLAPGVEGQIRVWDAKDRAHLTADAALFLPLRLGGQRIPDEPEQTRRQRRLNWLLGARARLPWAGLAELGGQLHDFTATFDRWRLGPLDSFLYSALLNRPDAEYFRRKGVAAFATWRPAEQWLAGVEYRRDTYASLVSLSPPLSLFRRDSPPFPNAPITEGRFASLIARLEYASDASARREVGSLFRSPELPLFSHDDSGSRRPSLRGFVTLEVGRPSFGGDPGTDFWKVVGDSVLSIPTGHDESLRVRLRAAGGENLPLQKREGLGGWSALRGYGFKELRGDASVLASATYRWEALGAFADVGAVRQEAGWTDARLGVGASLHFGDEVELAAAWRADERATWTPEVRLLFTRPF